MKKHLFFSLVCLLGLSACSSEHIALDAMKVYDVVNSACKLNLSETDTQPDIYETNIVKPASLSLQLEGDGIVRGVLEDVKGNCAVRKIHVQIANDDNKIMLVVYHDKLEALADCICNYDVSFKMSRLSAGDYDLKIYFASPGMKYTEEDLMYNGRCKLEKGHTTKITLKQGALPEV